MIRSCNHSSYPRVAESPLDQQVRVVLKAAERGKATAEEVAAAEDEVSSILVADQSRAFIDVVTDGMVRWEGPLSHLARHLDEQIGQVLGKLPELGLMNDTRVIYTSDHGESYGNHGLVGKCQLLETAAAVPLLMCGPGIPAGGAVGQLVSQVDLYPTLVEAVGAELAAEDADLPGVSLWLLILRARENA